MKNILTVFLIAAPVAAHAQSVTIARGEAVVLTLDQTVPDSRAVIVSRTPIVPSNYEIAAAAEFQTGKHDQAVGPNSEGMPGDSGPGLLAPTAEPGKVRFRFIRTPKGDQSLLSIENGYAYGLVYRARTHVKGKTVATDVCMVMPGKLGEEFWPYPIEALDLNAFKLVPWNRGDPVKCE